MCITGHYELGLACLIMPLVSALIPVPAPPVPCAAADGTGWTVQQLGAMKTGCQVIRALATSVRRLIVTASGTAKVTVEARSYFTYVGKVKCG